MFVDSIDPEQRYLKKRRYATKAKFDVYFSVRTPIDQFIERRNILKDVRWENYILIQHDSVNYQNYKMIVNINKKPTSRSVFLRIIFK